MQMVFSKEKKWEKKYNLEQNDILISYVHI